MTILIIEDTAELREVLKDEFIYHGFNVFEASDGIEGFKLLAQEKITVVLCDLLMPNGSGIQFLNEARLNFKELPIFIMTGFSDHSEKEIMMLGATGYFEKPYIQIEKIVSYLQSSKDSTLVKNALR